MYHDVVVLGDGPAGSALGAALTRRGVDVLVVGADAPWTATYGTWADDIEAITWLDTTDVWAERLPAIAVDVGGRRLVDRPYGVINNASLRTELRAGVAHLRGSAVDVLAAGSNGRDLERIVLSAGQEIDARVVVDATGWPGWTVRSSASGEAAVDPPRQTAFGVVLAERPSGHLGEAMLMDFSTAPGCDTDGLGPSFAYALPVADGWLVEETVLAARPTVPPDALVARLAARLGTTRAELLERAVRAERVDIPMGGPVPDRASRIIAFGAAAGMIHPATGYSLASSLHLADPVAEAIAVGLADAAFCHRRAWDVIWPTSARRSRLLHDYGLQVILDLDVVDTRSFFATFFELDQECWAAYLRVTTPPGRLARVMTSMFLAAPWRLRRRLVSQSPLAFARLLRPR